jgi:Ca2+-binding EF-hand superfamily protein
MLKDLAVEGVIVSQMSKNESSHSKSSFSNDEKESSKQLNIQDTPLGQTMRKLGMNPGSSELNQYIVKKGSSPQTQTPYSPTSSIRSLPVHQTPNSHNYQ